LHMVQLMPLHPKTWSSLVTFKSRLVVPFWYRLSQVVVEERPSCRRVQVTSMPSSQTEPVCMCSPEWITATSIVCKTSSVLAAGSVPVTLKFGESSLALDDKFVYTENPVITDIRPRDTFLRCVTLPLHFSYQLMRIMYVYVSYLLFSHHVLLKQEPAVGQDLDCRLQD